MYDMLTHADLTRLHKEVFRRLIPMYDELTALFGQLGRGTCQPWTPAGQEAAARAEVLRASAAEQHELMTAVNTELDRRDQEAVRAA